MRQKSTVVLGLFVCGRLQEGFMALKRQFGEGPWAGDLSERNLDNRAVIREMDKQRKGDKEAALT